MSQASFTIKELEAHSQQLKKELSLLKTERDALLKKLEEKALINENHAAYIKEIENTHNTIKNNELKLFHIIEFAECNIIIFDKNGIVQYANHNTLSLLNIKEKKQLIGKSIESLIQPKDRPAFNQGLKKMVTNHIELHTTLTISLPNGNYFTGIISAKKINDQPEQYAATIKNHCNTVKQELQKQEQIELMGNLSIFRMGVYKTQSIEELKKELCEVAQMYTSAERVWLMEYENGNYCNVHYSEYSQDKKLYEYKNIRQEALIIKPNQNLHSICTRRVNRFLQNNAVTAIPMLPHNQIHLQYILTFNTKSGKKYYWGFDYLKNDTIANKEHRFLEKLTPIVQPAFNSLEAYELLAENEARFRAFAEKQSDIILVRDIHGNYNYASPSVKKFELTPKDVIGKSFAYFVHPDDIILVEKALSSIINEAGKSISIPHLRIRIKEKESTIQAVLTNLLHQKGVDGIVVNIRDVTEITTAYRAIAQSEEKFRNIFENSSDAIFITDEDGFFLEINKKGIALLKKNKKKITNSTFQHIFGPNKDTQIRNYLTLTHKKGESSIQINHTNELGQTIYLEINGKTISYENRTAILNISRDISLRKEMERKILEASIKTEENERSRFAQDLHDGIGPYLSATKFFLQTLSDSKNKENMSELATKAIVSIDEIIIKVKEISNNISPHVLKNFGIISAINSFRKKLKSTNTEIELHTNIKDTRLQENIEVSIFRIVTELINNTLKYANAQKITITITIKDNFLILDFCHNGEGFNFEKTISENRGQGLFNIINRINSLNGKYSFTTNAQSSVYFNAIFEIKQQ